MVNKAGGSTVLGIDVLNLEEPSLNLDPISTDVPKDKLELGVQVQGRLLLSSGLLQEEA